jgi:hypothetical protein
LCWGLAVCCDSLQACALAAHHSRCQCVECRW